MARNGAMFQEGKSDLVIKSIEALANVSCAVKNPRTAETQGTVGEAPPNCCSAGHMAADYTGQHCSHFPSCSGLHPALVGAHSHQF